MPAYTGIQKEETLKSLVRDDFFARFGYEPNIDNIDFVITEKQARGDLFSDGLGSSRHYLWAEAKKGAHDIFDMFTQLILTCKKTYENGDHLAPPWLGAFDEARISFAAFHDVLPIFSEIDFNWTQTPNNHETIDFKKAREKVKNIIGAKIVTYNFGADDSEIKEFVKTHFTRDGTASIKSPITKDNFVQIFYKWLKEVMPAINIPKNEWADYKREGILEGDFFRADIMSAGGNTITEKLKIILENDNYKLQEKLKGRLFSTKIDFTDGGEAYKRFWNRYERPPEEVYHQFIIDRWDLLVPQNIREVKGSFFTPKIWADKSKEYLADVFGDNWQDEYYIWDCAAGTGNLLAGLKNRYNIWASDVYQSNVDTMLALIDIDDKLNLLPAHVFQFDFLNDSFDKLPEELRKIIDDEEKRKKLIVYINPPYAESSGGPGAKKGVSTSHIVHNEYKNILGKAANELFSLFMMRIMDKLSGCHLAVFSTLKYVNSSNFAKFRSNFSAKFQKGFICRADTFDNVNGKFPIGFLIWHLSYNEYDFKFPKSVKLDVFDNDGKRAKKKCFYNGEKYINKWIMSLPENGDAIGNLYFTSNDFQQNNLVYISLKTTESHLSLVSINKLNIFEISLYYSMRHCIEHTWINHNDQFLHPDGDDYKKDQIFLNDCLIFTLFGNKNYISRNDGVNHWIPFTEKEVGAKEKFASNFMSKQLSVVSSQNSCQNSCQLSVNSNVDSSVSTDISDKKPTTDNRQLATEAKPTTDNRQPTSLSPEANAVLDAGRELWRYYHAKIKTNNTASVNASFYDIREFFQGRNEAGKMNNKSNDETYNALIAALRKTLDALANKIEPKVYEYGFLKE